MDQSIEELFNSIQGKGQVEVTEPTYAALMRYQRDHCPANPKLVFRRDGAVLVGDCWVTHPALVRERKGW